MFNIVKVHTTKSLRTVNEYFNANLCISNKVAKHISDSALPHGGSRAHPARSHEQLVALPTILVYRFGIDIHISYYLLFLMGRVHAISDPFAHYDVLFLSVLSL